MDFNFLCNWFGITNTSTSNVSSVPGNDNRVEEYDNEFEIFEDYEFINPRNPKKYILCLIKQVRVMQKLQV
ncbi:hypothetical protein [Wolbachia endosymbiont of Mansonella perstans]|uniref:hypothetical protein n=1 Tax=Wolbachia endosymbiont of Mansonella perstans TaxID=229526 RepID=UPI001CE0BCE1|nr:hypothetical protein [Wolbachia endosymbiont of Mansonella perstans]MCA4774004.1 hypothetical protein [Wolbachia endosymbiont of Mansonella perstans]